MGIAAYESFTGKNGSSAESKTTPPPKETTYHIENKDVGLHHSANDFINQSKLPEPEESKPQVAHTEDFTVRQHCGSEA